MQIAINADDAIIANQILNYLQSFGKKIQIVTNTNNNSDFKSYVKSQQFINDRDELHQIFDDIKLNKVSTTAIDEIFWSNMDKVIERA